MWGGGVEYDIPQSPIWQGKGFSCMAKCPQNWLKCYEQKYETGFEESIIKKISQGLKIMYNIYIDFSYILAHRHTKRGKGWEAAPPV